MAITIRNVIKGKLSPVYSVYATYYNHLITMKIKK